MNGRPFRAAVNSADASAGIAIPIYLDGSNTAYTLKSDEYLKISTIKMVTTPGGDVFVFIGADGTPAVGEYIDRGTYAANGGLAHNIVPPQSGRLGHTIWVDAPIGVVDVLISGEIHVMGDDTTVRPTWQADL